MKKSELIAELSGRYRLVGGAKKLPSPSNAGTSTLYSQDVLELAADETRGVYRTVNFYVVDEGGKNELAFYEGHKPEKTYQD